MGSEMCIRDRRTPRWWPRSTKPAMAKQFGENLKSSKKICNNRGLANARVISSAVEHCLHTAGVAGSNPASPTNTSIDGPAATERQSNRPSTEKKPASSWLFFVQILSSASWASVRWRLLSARFPVARPGVHPAVEVPEATRRLAGRQCFVGNTSQQDLSQRIRHQPLCVCLLYTSPSPRDS